MIDDKDVERLRLIFMTREECSNTHEEINKKLTTEDVKLALIEQQLKTISWVAKTTLGAVIVAIVGALLALILR